jgi:hypothetical protein
MSTFVIENNNFFLLKIQHLYYQYFNAHVLNFFLISGVGLWVLRPFTGLLYQPRIMGDGDCEEIGGMKIGRGNRSTRINSAPAPLCPPQIPHD